MTRHLVAATILAAVTLAAHDDRYPARGGDGGGYDYGYDDDDAGYRAPAPPPPPAYAAAYRRPPMPRSGYLWVDSCWRFRGGRYMWTNGYWAPRPFAGAYWVGPRYGGGRFFAGYWGGGGRGGYSRHPHDRRGDNRGRYGYRR